MAPPISESEVDLKEENLMQIMKDIANDVGEVKGIQKGQASDIKEIKGDVKVLKENYMGCQRQKGRSDVLATIMVPIIAVLGGGLILLIVNLIGG